MLYDKRWDAKPVTKPDVFSLEGLIAWLDTMPADRAYCYTDFGRCLAAQFCAFAGRGYKVQSTFTPASSNEPFPLVLERIALEHPRTFSAALTRARKALADQRSGALADTSREAV